MHKIVYITGCLGFIGSHITKKCLELGWKVYGIDKCTYAANEELLLGFELNPNFKFQRLDINNLMGFKECDVIINTAAETHVDNSIAESVDFLNSNVYGVHRILNVMQRSKKVPWLIQFSTDEVYGDIVVGEHTESDILRPSNPYAATKASADMLINAWKRTFGVESTIIRPTNNYGKHQFPEKLIPCICKSVMQRKFFPLHQKGTPRRTWLHVEDTADAVIHIIQKNLKNEIFNIPGNYEDSNLNVATKVIKLLTGDDTVDAHCDFSYTRVGQDVRYSIDGEKLKATGWDNKRQFDKELPDIVAFYKKRFKDTWQVSLT
jgi:dTDP-glucose 4,6-dehydratase